MSDWFRRWRNTSSRWLFLAGALVVAVMFCSALYLQYVLHQDPCPLCMIQRLIFIVIGLVFLMAAIHDSSGWANRLYGALLVVFSILGVGVASRHIWIQSLPIDQVPGCGPGLDFMLQNFPLADIWQELMHGSGECAEKGWTFLSLGIPEWSLLAYVLLGVWGAAVAFRQNTLD